MPPGLPSNPGGSTSWKTIDIIKMAMVKIGVLDPLETPSAGDASSVLGDFNLMIDSFNADHRYIYAHQFITGTITPLLQPHLIGPTGTPTFVVNQRPVQIEGANILLNSPGPNTVRSKIHVHQDFGDWWESQRAPNIQSVIPTDMYYEPDWPNGSMFLWIVPQVAYPLELQLWVVLSQLGLFDSFSLPQGYLNAVVYSLAEHIAPSFDQIFGPNLIMLKNEALKKIWGPNLIAPRLGTRDAGIPSAHQGTRSNYNYRTKQTNT
jgi:hypothetical protein